MAQMSLIESPLPVCELAADAKVGEQEEIEQIPQAVDPRIPIEIKSPTEKLFISIKAVRQALENKVILLSRKSHTTDWKTATLAVGYNPPNDRAEVSRLIEDIKKTFGVKVGIIDFNSLLRISIALVRGEIGNYITAIRNMEGLINAKSV